MALGTRIVETPFSQGPELDTSDWRLTLPVISSGTVTLREPHMSDAPVLFELLTTERVARFISTPPSTLDGFERFIAFTERERAAGRFFCFAVVPRGINTPAGLIQVQGIQPASGTAEWGFALGSAFWGRGVFIHAAEALIDFAFETVGLTRLEARTCVLNGRGNGALAKLGAVKEAILRRSFHREGQYFDQVLWSIVRQDWRQSRAVFERVVVH